MGSGWRWCLTSSALLVFDDSPLWTIYYSRVDQWAGPRVPAHDIDERRRCSC